MRIDWGLSRLPPTWATVLRVLLTLEVIGEKVLSLGSGQKARRTGLDEECERELEKEIECGDLLGIEMLVKPLLIYTLQSHHTQHCKIPTSKEKIFRPEVIDFTESIPNLIPIVICGCLPFLRLLRLLENSVHQFFSPCLKHRMKLSATGNLFADTSPGKSPQIFFQGSCQGVGSFQGFLFDRTFHVTVFLGGTFLLSLTPTPVVGLCRGQLLIRHPIRHPKAHNILLAYLNLACGAV